MANKKGSGLLMVMADVPADKEEEFNRWYNEEHLADVTSVPGVLNGARYQAVKGGPKYLAIYELETYEVTHTPEFGKIREQRAEWSKRMPQRYWDQLRPVYLPPDLPRWGLSRRGRYRYGAGPPDRSDERSA